MKEISELYENMLETFREKTGFRMEHSSDLAVRLYAAAAELQSLYAYADWALRQSFPQSADGTYLEQHAQLRGITRKGGSRATGTLRFRVENAAAEDILIPEGTVCTTAGLVRFVTLQDAVLKAGDLTADAPARAEAAGVAGNVPSGSVTVLTKAPVGIADVTNPAAFQNGNDAENDEDLRARVLSSFRRLPNGANAAFYEQRALSNPDVKAVSVLPRENGIGTVGVVIAGEDGVPSESLISQVQNDLQRVREVAVNVTVRAPELIPVAVAAEITPKADVSFAQAKAAVESAVAACFTPQMLGKNVYRVAIGERIYKTGLVENYVLTAPAADVSAAADELAVLSGVSITEAE